MNTTQWLAARLLKTQAVVDNFPYWMLPFFINVVDGSSRASFKRWTFTTSGQCVEFRYGGCKGNGNKFDTQAQCEAFCSGLGGVGGGTNV